MTESEYQAGISRLLALMDMPLPDDSPEAEEFEQLSVALAEYEQGVLMRMFKEIEQ
jgi:hypothetical protein